MTEKTQLEEFLFSSSIIKHFVLLHLHAKSAAKLIFLTQKTLYG